MESDIKNNLSLNGRINPPNGRIYSQMNHDILSRIESGELRIGDRLPGVRDFVKEYKISKESVCKGINELVDQKILSKKQGHGIFVLQKPMNDREIFATQKTVLMVFGSDPYRKFASIQIRLGAVEYLAQFNLKPEIIHYDLSKSSVENRKMFHEKINTCDMAGVLFRWQTPFHSRVLASYPIVFIRKFETPSYFKRTCRVVTSHTEMTFLATEHLIQKGHRSIGFIASEKLDSKESSFIGYQEAMDEYGLEIDKNWTVHGLDYLANDTMDNLVAYFHRNQNMTAVYVTDDFLCSRVIDAIRSSGKSIPGDISLISFTNKGNDYCEYQKLTRMEVDQYEVGRRAAEALVKLIKGETKTGFTHYIPAELITGETVRDLNE